MSNVLSERFASRRLAKRESKDCAHHDDDGIVVECRTTSIYFVVPTTSLYVGETSDLQTRESDHNEGRGGSYTAKRRPVHIVYAEQCSSREQAVRRERQIKRWSLQKKELLIRGEVTTLSGRSERARIRTGFTWEDWLTRLRH